jgi:hypothetical protein
MQAVVQKHFNRLERSLREKSAERKLDGRRMKADWQEWDAEFGDDLHKALERIVEAEGGIYAMKLGGHNFDMGQTENYLLATAFGTAQAINDTIRQEIKDLGLDGALNQRAVMSNRLAPVSALARRHGPARKRHANRSAATA